MKKLNKVGQTCRFAILLITLCTTFATHVQAAPVRTVMTDTNGVIVSPTNFVSANGLVDTNRFETNLTARVAAEASLQTAVDGKVGTNDFAALKTNIAPNTVFVSASRGSTNGVGDINDPLLTIQAGTDAASQGDTVYVIDGTFQESITCKTNVGYYFCDGVVITNVDGSEMFNVTSPLTIRGRAAIQAGGSLQTVFLVSAPVDVECASISISTNDYGFYMDNNTTIVCKADSFTGGFLTAPFDGDVSDSLFKFKTFYGGFEEGTCVINFKDTALTLTNNFAFDGQFTFDGGSVTGEMAGSNLLLGTSTDASTISGATITGTYYIP